MSQLQNYYPTLSGSGRGAQHRIVACIGGSQRLLIVLHYPDLAEQAQHEMELLTTWDDALALKMRYSEAEFEREAETNVKVINGRKGGAAKHKLKNANHDVDNVDIAE